MSVVGTRPEAIKMAPVIREIRGTPGFQSIVCLTGQHLSAAADALQLFEVHADLQLQPLPAESTLASSFASLVVGMEKVITEARPDIVLVQGDTTSATAAAMAAFYCKTEIGHVEAGLRTNDLTSPWPEEGNRQIVARLARLNFAPTESARENLIREGICPYSIEVTGNTVIDALLHIKRQVLPRLESEMRLRFQWIDPSKHLVLVTGHRRENQQNGLGSICKALVRLAARRDCQVAYVKHMNPAVQRIVDTAFGDAHSVHVLDPQPYANFVWLMTKASFVLTDSGGIQEEAPALGLPVLVARRSTERHESMVTGIAQMVGTDEHKIYEHAVSLLEDERPAPGLHHSHSPYGDGEGARRIVQRLGRLASKDSTAG